jgi:hypothetical protein
MLSASPDQIEIANSKNVAPLPSGVPVGPSEETVVGAQCCQAEMSEAARGSARHSEIDARADKENVDALDREQNAVLARSPPRMVVAGTAV